VNSKNCKAKRPATFRTSGVASPLKASLAFGVSTLMLMPQTVLAEGKPNVTRLSTVKVQDEAIDPNPNAEPGVPYKARTSGDERYTRPLAETPKNITVITKSAIDESGSTDLREILDAQPGITLGTGENGNAFGDRYIIRGQEARSDVFVDGLRDPGMTIRESFATEQVEISKGPDSSFAGRGTSGGGINAITKQATRDYNFVRLSTGFGTDDHTRLTLDANQALGDAFAVRANLLHSYEEVPDRGPADRTRNGVALSGLFEPTDKLSVTLDYYGLRAEDTPDLGSYMRGTVPHRRPVSNAPVYAQEDDFLESDVDTVTARIKYAFTDDVRITNLMRRGKADNGFVTTGARISTTDASDPNGAYETVSLSTHDSWQEVDYFANQTNLFVNQLIGGRKNEFIFSIEYTNHEVLNGRYDVVNAAPTNCLVSGRGGVSGSYCVINPDGSVVNGINTLMDRRISKGDWDLDWQVKTISAAIMDTVDLTDSWTLFAGVRYDHFDFDLATFGTPAGAGPGTAKVKTPYDYSDGLWNGHVGVTYKINPQGMVYFSVATASDINGGESDVGTSSGYGGLVIEDVPAGQRANVADADPETSQSIELGTKWNLRDDTLLLTAAVFQITKDDIMEGADYDSVGTYNTGKNRIRGIEVGLVGEITNNLTAQAGFVIMDAEVLKSATESYEGKTLSNFADKSAVAQLRYEFTEQFAVGGGMRYEDVKYAGQPDTAAAFDAATGHYSQPIPSYAVYDLFATYQHNRDLGLRLNVGNVTDKDYYTAAYRSGSFVYKGDGRNIRLTVSYEFN
jgi:catecholate siderophore receptor